jgi:O-antigen ligase
VADIDRLTPLEGTVLVFVAACFLLPTGPAYAAVFYLAVVPCLGFRMARWRGEVPRDAALWLGVALIAWSGLTLCWGRDDGGRTVSFALATGSTLAFWTALRATIATPSRRERLARVLVGAATLNAVAGLARTWLDPPYQPPGDTRRLHGWGITYHPVLGAAVLSVCLLTALDMAVRDSDRRRWHLAAAAVIALAIALTKSRGPELAVTVAAIMLAAAGPARRAVPALLALPPLAWLTGAVRIGSTGHFQIWQATWTEIKARPWAGHGLAADLPAYLGGDKRFPHDLYLSVMFYSGAVGLMLFGVWAAVLAVRLVKARGGADTPWIAALCVNALMAGISDDGQITKGPGPLWLILWLPAAMAAAVVQTAPARRG